VTHHPSYLGGGFGRRLPFNWNVIDHATKIAMEFNVPVKTVFSREDDMQQDYYRPAVTSNFKAGLDSNGKVVAWENRYTGPVQTPGAAHIPYDIANQSIRYVDGNTHVPVAAWRSVDHSQQTFFTESFIDELAHRVIRKSYALLPKQRVMAETCRQVMRWDWPYRKVLAASALKSQKYLSTQTVAL
jgi:isoquinoline 1-oxidoreductase beta subunit